MLLLPISIKEDGNVAVMQRLKAFLNCHACPPRAAVLQMRNESKDVLDEKYIVEWPADDIGMSKGICGYRYWKNAESSSDESGGSYESHSVSKDDDGNVIHTEDIEWTIKWAWIDGVLTNLSTGSLYITDSSDPKDSWSLSGSVVQNDDGTATWNVPGWLERYPWGRLLPYIDLEVAWRAPGFANEEAVWSFSNRVSYEMLRDKALEKLEDFAGEWEEAGGSIVHAPAKVSKTQLRLKINFGKPWQSSFGPGVKGLYRFALTTTNGSCQGAVKSPAVKKEWIEGDRETPLIVPEEGEEETYSTPLDGVPEAEDLSGDDMLQSKTLVITGPSRKLYPTLEISNTYSSQGINAFQAYDGSDNYYRTETAAGFVTGSATAGVGWTVNGNNGVKQGIINSHASLGTGNPITNPNLAAAPQEYTPPTAPTTTSHVVFPGEDKETIFTLSQKIGANEALQAAQDSLIVGTFRTAPAWQKHVLASCTVGATRLVASVMSGYYKVTISRPTLSLDESGNVTAKWKIHTLNTATGSTTVEDKSESYTWPAKDTEGPGSYEPGTKTFGPYEVTANEGELKWIEVLEPEEAQHVWPNPIWYVAKGP